MLNANSGVPFRSPCGSEAGKTSIECQQFEFRIFLNEMKPFCALVLNKLCI